ncbi:MAG: phosphate ABC transporter permease PstA [Pseudonocardiaceae bacterium]
MTTTIPPRTAGRPDLDTPGAPDAPAVEVRRSTAARTQADVIVLIGAAVAALSLAALLTTRVIRPETHEVLHLTANAGSFVVIAYLLFLVLYGVLVSLQEDGRTVRDRLASVAVHSLAVLALIALVFIVSFTFLRARETLPHRNFYSTDMTRTGPLDPLTSGGILHGAVGTLIEIAIALIITIPLGLACAVYLSETRGAMPRFVRTVVEAMTALPSIVAGLFILAFWILTLGFVKSGLAAALAISVMMLPIIIRAADVVIRLVPGSLREASLAMGASQWRTVWYVVLPTARSGLTTAVLLGTARGIGETSPVLLTAGFGSSVNYNPFAGPMPSLPLLAFNFASFPERVMVLRAFGSGTVLVAMVLVLFGLARVLGGRPAGELSARGQRHRAQQSLRDLSRFTDRDRSRGMESRHAT